MVEAGMGAMWLWLAVTVEDDLWSLEIPSWSASQNVVRQVTELWKVSAMLLAVPSHVNLRDDVRLPVLFWLARLAHRRRRAPGKREHRKRA